VSRRFPAASVEALRLACIRAREAKEDRPRRKHQASRLHPTSRIAIPPRFLGTPASIYLDKTRLRWHHVRPERHRGEQDMPLAAGDTLLNGRYVLTEVSVGALRDPAARWIGTDERRGGTVLVKTWDFDADRPNEYHRGLWASELRALYKLASSRHAPETLLSLRDAEIDKAHRCFVMVMEAENDAFTPVSTTLGTRARQSWLNVRERKSRGELWRGIRLVLRGIRTLHRHRLLHRRVSAENLFCEPHIGPSSFRLGGFEWSVRLGVPATSPAHSDWSVPPEFMVSSGLYGYTMDTDWYAFAVMAARLLIPCEPLANIDPDQRHEHLLRNISESPDLFPGERDLLRHLLPREPERRIGVEDRLVEIERRIQSIIDELTSQSDAGGDRPLLMAINLQAHFIDKLRAALEPTVSPDSQDAVVPQQMDITTVVKRVQADLQNAQIAPFGRDELLLVGDKVRLIVRQWQPNTAKTWDAAFCSRFFNGALPVDMLPLPAGRIQTTTPHELRRDQAFKRRSRSWSLYVESLHYESDLSVEIGWLFDFLRCTNQLEFLMRTTEMFRYTLVSESSSGGHIVIAESVQEGQPSYLVSQGLANYYQHKLDKADEDEHTRLLLFADDELEEAWGDVRRERARAWRIVDVDVEANQLELRPADDTIKATAPPPSGWVRPADMHGQLQLIARRIRAIRDLRNHYYLLKALAGPADVCIDTRAELASAQLDPSLDDHKKAIIEDIMRVRPIYALQGPPGTGKTRLVAHLVAHILSDDPVAQILITAPTNWAVDVLRQTVSRVARAGGASDEPTTEAPFAVRLYSRRPGRQPTARLEGSAEQVSKYLLETAVDRLDAVSPPEPGYEALRQTWRQAAIRMIGCLVEEEPDPDTANFCELVRLGANFTYCTTSSGDLEELAKGDQSFDWSIIEEAGKSHGYDLALPMQAGHRWLLLGDQRQLEPHRIDYFDEVLFATDAKQALNGALGELRKMPDSAQNLRDTSWLKRWFERYNEREQDAFIARSREYLRTFSFVFESCKTVTGQLTKEVSTGCYAATLNTQYRMHPDMGELISKVYYPSIAGGLKCKSDPYSVTHKFTFRDLPGRSIVWLDMPWASKADENEFTHFNPNEIVALDGFMKALSGSHKYDEEDARRFEFAILSPYRQQVRVINEFYRDDGPTLAGLQLKEGRRRTNASARAVAHTVDQFQGDEAHVVMVSLVRNMRADSQPQNDPALPLGFLKSPSRMNVLLSRAQALLVIVGSWSFFEHVAAAIPPRADTVASAYDDDSPAHWVELVALLRDWCADKRALRIDASPWLDDANPDTVLRAWRSASNLMQTRTMGI
jgi:serine/threonine protein kinase